MRRLTMLVLLSVLGTVHAAEGMWEPKQLPDIAKELKAAGLKIDPASLTDLTDHPMNAVIDLAGCTASFVSSQGLVITNHPLFVGHAAVQLDAGERPHDRRLPRRIDGR